MRRVTKALKARALESLELAVEFFNRPSGTGRTEAVLILLQRAFEMLLKATIYERRGAIVVPGGRETHKFGKCIAIGASDLGLLNEDMARTLRSLNGQRDAAMHYYIELSESALYLHTQAGLTLFADILEKAFGEKLAAHLPNRVLPVCSHPLQDLTLLFDEEFSQIRRLLQPGKRRTAEVCAHLRPIAIMESNVDGEGRQPTDDEVRHIAERLKKGEDWRAIFPGISTLRLETTGEGLTYNVRVVKNSLPAVPIHLTSSDSDTATVVIREANLLERYPLIQKSLIEQLNRSQTQIRALIWHYKIKEHPEYYREFAHHSHRIQGYSNGAVTRLQQELHILNAEEMEQICHRYREHERARRKSTPQTHQ
jgi:uncharacterized protein YutE (UPF0331/DUF86 family)